MIEVDVWQILKDLGTAAGRLKDAKAQAEINTLLAQLTSEIRVKETSIYKLESENRKLKEVGEFIFPEGENYLVDRNSPKRALCPLCTKKHMTAVPLEGHYCRQCKGVYDS